MQEDTWPRIAVMGAGALGCYFGGMFARAGARVTLIGRAQHVEAMTRAGLSFDSIQFRQQIPVSASTDAAAVRDAEIVLLCVKTVDTEEAAISLAPHLASGAVLVSLQNGVDNVERIRSATGIEAIPASVYVAAEMTGPGCVKHTARGDLAIGDLSGLHGTDESRRQQLGRLAMLFGRAGISCTVSENIAGELCRKSGTLLPNYPCNPLELKIRKVGTLCEKFEFSRALVVTDRLRLGAGNIRQDRAGSGREGWSGASARASLVLDSHQGAA